MARRKKNADEQAAATFPKDQEEIPIIERASAPPAPPQDEDDEEEEIPSKPAVTIETLQQDIIKMQERHSSQMDALRRQIAPAAAPTDPAKTIKDEIDGTDWDNELFSQPKVAVKKIIDRAVKEATGQ